MIGWGGSCELIWPLVMVKNNDLRTLPMGTMWFENVSRSGCRRQTELMMNTTFMNLVLLMTLFVVLQKYLVRGIQLEAVKG
jgi:multiple sugar transport system permease protein